MGSNNSFTDPPIKLENNPTVNYSQLIITSNIMEYGVYKLVHWVYVKVDTGYLKDIPNEIEHFIDVFIHIVPGGIALFCLENGLDNIKIGKKQTLELNPIKYAYDMDFLVTANSLNYTFYCKQINSSQNIKDIRDIDFSESDDLLSFKYSKNSSLKNECFNSSDDLEFDSTGKIITINNLLNNYSLFIVTTYHLSKLYFQTIKVENIEIEEVPYASIKCRFESFCRSYGKLAKINPAYQLILDSSCARGCERSVETRYKHKIYFRYENEENSWVLFNKTLLEMCTIGETEQEFTILPKIFSLNTNILYWKVELEVKAIFSDQTSSSGLTSMHFKINEKPFNGYCTINSTRGYALKTLFAIECSSWTDND
ncbi:unnamed protein product, partial [Brachionus calyciflorus]